MFGVKLQEMTDRKSEHRFVATLYKVGINRCVDVPEEVSRTLRGKGYIPVVATAQGLVTRTTLVPAGNRQRCGKSRKRKKLSRPSRRRFGANSFAG